MSIVAALDKVLFFNASSKYSVLRMKTEDSSVPTEARSPYRYHDHLIRFTAVGIELPQTDTVKIEMDGEWKDGKYGLQLQVDHWQEIVPPTLEGVRNYLASGLLKGIGEKTADAIIEKFGVNALEILEHQPDRLLEIRGITKERLAEIKDAYPYNPFLRKISPKNQLPCNQQPAADLFELVALTMLHNRFAHRQAQFDLLRRGIFQHACKFNRNADVWRNRNVASKQSIKINAQCCRYIHQ